MSRSDLPRAILAASAVMLGGLGIALAFAPDELGPVLGLVSGAGAPTAGASTPETLGLEVFAGALFAFGFLNWLARGAVYGGIYGRPIVLGNLVLGVMVALTLLRHAVGGEGGAGRAPQAVLGTVFGVHALAFAWILLRARPWGSGDGGDEAGADG